MFKYILLILCLLFAINSVHSEIYAVIVASSKGYHNYRHQADTCQAYHLLINGGVKPQNIIHFAYNDIANHEFNPFQGKIFNRPDKNGPGEDVYKDCKIDYEGTKVNPENVLKVLRGEKSEELPIVLESTAEDNVFIYFNDHGGAGVLAFPDHGLYLYKEELWEAIKFMDSKKKFKKLTIYIEACQSGSLFKNIDFGNMNVYALTAANFNEPSYAAFCDYDAVVNGTHLNTCLSNQFTAFWVDDVLRNGRMQSLKKQAESIKEWVTLSQVKQWLSTNFIEDKVGDYMGHSKDQEIQLLFSRFKKQTDQYDYNSKYNEDNRMTKLNFIKKQIEQKQKQNSEVIDGLEELQKELALYEKLVETFSLIAKEMEVSEETEPEQWNFSCYKDLIKTFESKCTYIPEYSLQYLNIFANICSVPDVDLTHIHKFIYQVCEPIRRI